MKFWIEIFDKEDTDVVVDSYERYGSANIHQNNEMKPGDVVFIYSKSEGRVLYRTYVSRLNSFVAENGTPFVDTYLKEPMIISESLTLDSLKKLGLDESALKENVANPMDNGEVIARLQLVFDNEDDYSTPNAHQEKMRIIFTARDNCREQ